jgi:adenosylhomocysteine nucleosidase
MMQPVNEISFDSLELLSEKTLFVFALPSEAAEEFEHVNKVFVGIGKVNAAYELTSAIRKHKPQLIINLGSAGSNFFKRGEVICCTKFIQRDMDVRGLGFKLYETPFSNIDPLLNYGIKIKGLPEGVCGSGDSFEMNHSVSDYDVIDMEAYPLAYISMMENIPFLCLKYISDGADGTAADDWAVQVHNAATAFRKILFPPG